MIIPSALPDNAFRSYAPGYWQDKNISPRDWNSSTWQLKNRVTSLAGLEEHLVLADEERAGVLLSGNKLAMAITPHYFNLIDRLDPDCPIRRQVVP
ncbi:MAG: lysine 2,3-aminomutase YodO family protein, partial [Verrucomicrobiaceae bacterium]|nr:lysine 2,3-aminomutase YodO family protein [Verrucomicrobiaceae bacterium]